MGFIKGLLVFIFLFNFSCSKVSTLLRSPANTTNTTRYRLPRVNKSDFNKRLEKELIRQVEIIEKKLSEPEAKALQKIRKKAYQIVVDLNPWGHIKHMLIQHGKGAAITAAITEIVTVGIMPAILTAAGMPGAALFSASFPSFSITVPAYIFWKNARQKKRLAKELGFESLKDLDLLRKEILGFCTSTRLVSKVYEGAEGQVEINIIKRRFSKWRESPTGNMIDLYDLEKIAKEELDQKILEILKPLSKDDGSVYATVLIDQVSKNPGASVKLSELIKKQMNDLPFRLSDHQQTMLLLVHEKEAYIKTLKMKVRKYKGNTLKEVRRLSSDKEAKKVVSEFMENILSDLDALELDIKRFEYGFLNRVSLGETIAEQDVDEAASELLRRMTNAQTELLEYEVRLKAINAQSDLLTIQTLLADMKKSNLKWKPFQSKTIGEEQCSSLVAKLLSQSKVVIQ